MKSESSTLDSIALYNGVSVRWKVHNKENLPPRRAEKAIAKTKVESSKNQNYLIKPSILLLQFHTQYIQYGQVATCPPNLAITPLHSNANDKFAQIAQSQYYIRINHIKQPISTPRTN